MKKRCTRKRITAQEIANILEWQKQGVSISKIAKEVGRSIQAVYLIIQRSVSGVYINKSPRGNVKKIEFKDKTPTPFSGNARKEKGPIRAEQDCADKTALVELVFFSKLSKDTKLRVIGELL